ncbi:MAG TPA: hypothetical protein PKV67_16240 [Hyphomonas sp.]|nr:hypothetical protein [Hyphomonas sp.]HRJ02297.1 hypothetical protein [Hyphomonas sp.]HRK68400.1 hypothetical protein [Hyphomonas sp.]
MTATVAIFPASGTSQLPNRLMADEPRFTLLGVVLAFALIPVFAAMAVETRTYQDMNVWMKPAKFMISLSLYTLNLALFARFLPAGMTARRRYRAYSTFVVLCILAEMIWIGGAAAMGVGSHFNRSTPELALIYTLMGVIAISLTTASLVFGIAILRNRASGLAPGLRLSIGLGLVLTFVLTVPVAMTMAMGTGHLVGTPQTGAMLPVMGWSREVGDLRIAHFFATHAMQLLPLFGLLTLALPRHLAVPAVWTAAAGYAALVIATFVQALAGQPFLQWMG